MDLLKALAEYGILGLVCAIALAFAWYQTKQLEYLRAEQLRDLKRFANRLADIFELNKGNNDEQALQRGSSGIFPAVGSAGTEGRQGAKGAGDEKAALFPELEAKGGGQQ